MSYIPDHIQRELATSYFQLIGWQKRPKTNDTYSNFLVTGASSTSSNKKFEAEWLKASIPPVTSGEIDEIWSSGGDAAYDSISVDADSAEVPKSPPIDRIAPFAPWFPLALEKRNLGEKLELEYQKQFATKSFHVSESMYNVIKMITTKFTRDRLFLEASEKFSFDPLKASLTGYLPVGYVLNRAFSFEHFNIPVNHHAGQLTEMVDDSRSKSPPLNPTEVKSIITYLNAIDQTHLIQFHAHLAFWMKLFTFGYPHYTDKVNSTRTFAPQVLISLCLQIAALRTVGWVEPQKRPSFLSPSRINTTEQLTDQGSIQIPLPLTSGSHSTTIPPPPTLTITKLESIHNLENDSQLLSTLYSHFSILLRRLFPLIPALPSCPINPPWIRAEPDELSKMGYFVDNSFGTILQIAPTSTITLPERVINSIVGYSHCLPPLPKPALENLDFAQSIRLTTLNIADAYLNPSNPITFQRFCELYIAYTPVLYDEMVQYQTEWYRNRTNQSNSQLDFSKGLQYAKYVQLDTFPSGGSDYNLIHDSFIHCYIHPNRSTVTLFDLYQQATQKLPQQISLDGLAQHFYSTMRSSERFALIKNKDLIQQGFLPQFYTFADIITCLEYAPRINDIVAAYPSLQQPYTTNLRPNQPTAFSQVYLGSCPTVSAAWPQFLSTSVSSTNIDDFFTLFNGLTIPNPEYNHLDQDQNKKGEVATTEEDILFSKAIFSSKEPHIQLIPPSERWFDNEYRTILPWNVHNYVLNGGPNGKNFRKFTIFFQPTSRVIETFFCAILFRADAQVLTLLLNSIRNDSEQERLMATLSHTVVQFTGGPNETGRASLFPLTIIDCMNIASTDLYGSDLVQLVTTIVHKYKSPQSNDNQIDDDVSNKTIDCFEEDDEKIFKQVNNFIFDHFGVDGKTSVSTIKLASVQHFEELKSHTETLLQDLQPCYDQELIEGMKCCHYGFTQCFQFFNHLFDDDKDEHNDTTDDVDQQPSLDPHISGWAYLEFVCSKLLIKHLLIEYPDTIIDPADRDNNLNIIKNGLDQYTIAGPKIQKLIKIIKYLNHRDYHPLKVHLQTNIAPFTDAELSQYTKTYMTNDTTTSLDTIFNNNHFTIQSLPYQQPIYLPPPPPRVLKYSRQFTDPSKGSNPLTTSTISTSPLYSGIAPTPSSSSSSKTKCEIM